MDVVPCVVLMSIIPSSIHRSFRVMLLWASEDISIQVHCQSHAVFGCKFKTMGRNKSIGLMGCKLRERRGGRLQDKLQNTCGQESRCKSISTQWQIQQFKMVSSQGQRKGLFYFNNKRVWMTATKKEQQRDLRHSMTWNNAFMCHKKLQTARMYNL